MKIDGIVMMMDTKMERTTHSIKIEIKDVVIMAEHITMDS
jgi:hypothetical protein